MPCTCDFALESGSERLVLNFELTCELSRRTEGDRYYYSSRERVGSVLDPCGVTLIPPETLSKLKSVLASLSPADITDYDEDFDDSPYPLDKQIERLSNLIAEAIDSNEWLICFGA